MRFHFGRKRRPDCWRPGSAARQPLLELADGTDPETRASARRLVALIDRSEFRRRLDAFAADTDGKKGLTLPGWRNIRNSSAATAARTLFVEMHRQEGPLIAAIFGKPNQGPPKNFSKLALVRIAQWQNPNGEHGSVPPIGSSAAMLFSARNARNDHTERRRFVRS